MAVRPFLIWPDPRLATSGAPVIRVDAATRADFVAIEAAMDAAGLSALSGPQIGIMRRLAVTRWPEPGGGEAGDWGPGGWRPAGGGAGGAAGGVAAAPARALRLANLKLLWLSRDVQERDQTSPCLPGAVARVPRATVVIARWIAETGESVERVLSGARAAELQLLVDHLDGVTPLDRIGPDARRAAIAAMRRGRGREASAPAPSAMPAMPVPSATSATPAPPATPVPSEVSAPPARSLSLGPSSKDFAAMRLIFMGTPDFSVCALDALIAAGHEIAAVYTQPPRPAGRGKKPRASAVQARAEALGLMVRSPASLRGPEAQADLAALGADLAVVVAYGLILPRAVLDAPRLGCVNIHASLLPRWRGAAPIQRAIMAGDAQTGVCIMRMEAGLDTGPVLLRRATPIGPADGAASLHDRLAAMGGEMIVEALASIDAGVAAEAPQPTEGVTYAAKIDKAEAQIDWTLPAAEIDRRIRALSPAPGAWFIHDGARIKALMCVQASGAGAPGEVLDDALTVACGEGALRIEILQRAGKGAMSAAEALRGLPIPKGARLG
jgi:methionyl-tRNA formyltransferase